MQNRQPIRRRYSAAQRRNFVRLYRKSGLSQSEFARTHDLKPPTLHQWLHRAKPQPTSSGPVFQEMPLPSPLVAPVLEITVGPEITLRLRAQVSPEFIAQIVQHLRRPC